MHTQYLHRVLNRAYLKAGECILFTAPPKQNYTLGWNGHLEPCKKAALDIAPHKQTYTPGI